MIPASQKQAKVPQVEIFINDQLVTIPPDALFTFEYRANASNEGNEFTFEFYDPTWTLLEDKVIPSLVRQNKSIRFRWGYGADLMSEYRYGTITEIQPGVVSRGGIEFTVSGFDQGSVEGVDAKPAMYRGKISDIVIKICKEKGWTPKVTETKEIFEYDSRTKEKKPKVWRRDKVHTLVFLKMLAQRAEAVKGPGEFIVRFNDKTKPPTLYFGPREAVKKDIFHTYIWQTDGSGEVLTFQPEVNGAALTALGLSTTKVLVKDPNTRETKTVQVDSQSFNGSVALGKKAHVKPGKTITKSLPPMTEEEAKNRLNNFYARLRDAALSASMDVIGDPRLEPDILVKVIIFTPKQTPYFTSGIYWVHGVTHRMEAGNYVCSLQMMRNALDTGDVKLRGPIANTAQKRG